ncbi:cytochrome P450 [Streptomyces sp. NPDC048514]|uniref:cytochrome P450 n=1 Tax=Streptomyces sp. NPDC048514 TaxID=3365564 RepID=UPI0037101A9D
MNTHHVPSPPAPATEPGRAVFTPSFLADPHPVVDGLLARGSLHRVTHPTGRTVWLVTHDADVRSCLRDTRLSLSHTAPTPGSDSAAPTQCPDTATALAGQGTAAPVAGPGTRTLLEMDGPEHLRLRRLAGRALSLRAVRHQRAAVERRAERIARQLRSVDHVDLVRDYAVPLSFHTICDTLGLPPRHRASLFRSASVLQNPARHPGHLVDHHRARVRARLGEELRRRRRHPGSRDGMDRVAQAWSADPGLGEDLVVTLCETMLLTASGVTAHMIGTGLLALLERPHLVDELCRGDLPADRLVHELLRWETVTPFSTRRTATADVPLTHATLPKGAEVYLCFASANRDPNRHADPATFDPHRSTTTGHLAFGLGPHYCPGGALAVLEIEVALSSLFRLFPKARILDDPATRVWNGSFLERAPGALPARLAGALPIAVPRAGTGSNGPAAGATR